MRMTNRSTLLCSLLLAACGGDGDSGSSGAGTAQFARDTTCGVAIAVSGDFADRIGARDSVACVTQHSVSEGMDIGFLHIDAAFERVELHIDDVLEGETGSFPAIVEIGHEDGREWSAEPCTVNIETHADQGPAELGQAYRVRGTGECTLPATSDTNSELTLAAFAFVATITWAD